MKYSPIIKTCMIQKNFVFKCQALHQVFSANSSEKRAQNSEWIGGTLRLHCCTIWCCYTNLRIPTKYFWAASVCKTFSLKKVPSVNYIPVRLKMIINQHLILGVGFAEKKSLNIFSEMDGFLDQFQTQFFATHLSTENYKKNQIICKHLFWLHVWYCHRHFLDFYFLFINNFNWNKVTAWYSNLENSRFDPNKRHRWKKYDWSKCCFRQSYWLASNAFIVMWYVHFWVKTGIF